MITIQSFSKRLKNGIMNCKFQKLEGMSLLWWICRT